MRALAAYGITRFDAPEAPHEAGPEAAPRLTPRQREVLLLLCEGLPNKLICRQLNISPGTVKVHISCIFREFGVGSRLQAVVWAKRHGLVAGTAGTAPRIAAEAAPIQFRIPASAEA